MPILLHDMEALVEDIRDEVRRVRVLRDDAYRLAMMARRMTSYGPDGEFTAAVDAVLGHFTLAAGG